MGNGTSGERTDCNNAIEIVNSSGIKISISHRDRIALHQSWNEVADKLVLGEQIFLKVFTKAPSIKSAFGLRKDEFCGSFSDKAEMKDLVVRFVGFFDAVFDSLEFHVHDALLMFRKLGQMHASMPGKINFNQSYFVVFVQSITNGVVDALQLKEPKSSEMRQIWQTFLELMIGEMRDSIFKQECRHARRGTLHTVLGWSANNSLAPVDSADALNQKRASC